MKGSIGPLKGWRRYPLWLSGLWVFPLWWVSLSVLQASLVHIFVISVIALAVAPLPGLVLCHRHQARLLLQLKQVGEEAELLNWQMRSIRDRTVRLREELSNADRQARLSHQLALLGQFTAGFLHEYNNPLAIVTNRIEILLEERKHDADLCTDLQQMLKETRYMANIAGTLLRALRRERSGEAFEASVPTDVLRDVVAAMSPSAAKQSVHILLETTDVPRVNLPAHVISEVVRGLIANALEALKDRGEGTIWLRLDPYRTAGARVVLRVEDNGPGVPESIREHLFEPFASQSPGRERLGLGLFLAASLLDTYDGSLRYEPRSAGGAAFIMELPPARFTRGQPYHWSVKADPA